MRLGRFRWGVRRRSSKKKKGKRARTSALVECGGSAPGDAVVSSGSRRNKRPGYLEPVRGWRLLLADGRGGLGRSKQQKNNGGVGLEGVEGRNGSVKAQMRKWDKEKDVQRSSCISEGALASCSRLRGLVVRSGASECALTSQNG